MIEIVKVIGVEALGDYRLRLLFSDGSSGMHDFTEIVSEPGPMVTALRDKEFFRRVFISVGVLTWPNGYDLDSIRLHNEMKAVGELTTTVAA